MAIFIQQMKETIADEFLLNCSNEEYELDNLKEHKGTNLEESIGNNHIEQLKQGCEESKEEIEDTEYLENTIDIMTEDTGELEDLLKEYEEHKEMENCEKECDICKEYSEKVECSAFKALWPGDEPSEEEEDVEDEYKNQNEVQGIINDIEKANEYENNTDNVKVNENKALRKFDAPSEEGDNVKQVYNNKNEQQGMNIKKQIENEYVNNEENVKVDEEEKEKHEKKCNIQKSKYKKLKKCCGIFGEIKQSISKTTKKLIPKKNTENEKISFLNLPKKNDTYNKTDNENKNNDNYSNKHDKLNTKIKSKVIQNKK